MRVLILATDIYSRRGIARYTCALATALGQLLGPDNVHVLPLLDRGALNPVATPYVILDGTTDRLTKRAKARHIVRALAWLRKGYHLIVCSHVALAPIAAMARILFKTPYFVVCHGDEAWARLPLLKRCALRAADRILPVSQFTADKVSQEHRIPPAKTKVLYNAIPDDMVDRLTSVGDASLSAVPSRSGTLILSVGSLSKESAYKGFDTVIRALPRLVGAVPEVRYAIIGTGNGRSYLEQLARRLNVGNRVTFAGEVADLELAAYYRACDVFVLPSKAGQCGGRWHGEGFGRVYVEAALAGKPVVGSLAAGAAEAVLSGKTGFLVDPDSVEDLVSRTVALLTKPELANQMGCEGRRWAKKRFTLAAMRSRLAEILWPCGYA